MKTLTYLLRYLFYCLIISILCICACYYYIEYSTRPYLYDNPKDIPKNSVGIVLGTAKYVQGGRINVFYRRRIEAAVKLWQAGKVQYFIVSGANPSKYYNEPEEMRRDLIAAGIPQQHIQPDYAGLRTLDSILRAEKIFNHRRYTIISQAFHNARAVFLARQNGHEVIAYNAADPVSWQYNLKTHLREFGARVKAVIDVFILKKQAKFYGDPIEFPKVSTRTATQQASP